jgi:hypothetical protein
MSDVYVVMIDSGNAEGNPSGRQGPHRVFESLIEAKAYAMGKRERPKDATFWIPPAYVEVIKVPLVRAGTR